MTDAELNAEQDALSRAYADLKMEHTRLIANPRDVAGHIDHLRKMHAHIERLRKLTDALRTRTRHN